MWGGGESGCGCGGACLGWVWVGVSGCGCGWVWGGGEWVWVWLGGCRLREVISRFVSVFVGGAVVSSYLAQSVAVLGDMLIALKYFAVVCPQPLVVQWCSDL